jgi:hypothetical protein
MPLGSLWPHEALVLFVDLHKQYKPVDALDVKTLLYVLPSSGPVFCLGPVLCLDLHNIRRLQNCR